MDFVNFKAPVTGDLISTWMWWKTNNGRTYSRGDRGSYEVRYKASNGAATDPEPVGSTLANYTETNFLDNDSDNNIRISTLSTPLPVTAGTQYHAEICNTHPDAFNNHNSINCLTAEDGNSAGLTKPTPIFNNNGCMHLEGWGFNCTFEYIPNGGSYKERTPCIIFQYDTTGDGIPDTFQGVPYWDACHHDHASLQPQPITATTWFRQTLPPHNGFNPILNRVAVAMTRATSLNPLIVEIVDSSNTVLGGVTIPANSFNESSGGEPRVSPRWASATLPSIALTGGQTYYLQMRTTGTTVFYPNMLIDASRIYKAPKGMTGEFGGFYGTDNKSQVSFNSGSTWQNYYLLGSNPYTSPSTPQTFHLAFYFEVS